MPLDVMNYIRDIQRNPKARTARYWKNTSDNEIIRSFIDLRREVTLQRKWKPYFQEVISYKYR